MAIAQLLLYELYPWLVFFYFLDSFVFLRHQQRAYLVSRLQGGRCLFRRFSFSSLLPSSFLFDIFRCPVILTPDAVYFPDPKIIYPDDSFLPNRYKNIALNQIESILTSSNGIELNGQSIYVTQNKKFLRHLAGRINELKNCPQVKRQKLVHKYLSEDFDSSEPKLKFLDLRKSSFISSILCSLFLILFFSALPLLTYFPKLYPHGFDICFIFMGFLYFTILINSLLIRKKNLGSFGLSSHLVFIILPQLVPKLAGHLYKNIFCTLDHLVLAANFLPRDSFLNLARREFNQILLAQKNGPNHPLFMYWSKRLSHIESLVQNFGLDTKRLSRQPERIDLVSQSYCPICESQFIEGAKNCSTCQTELKSYT